MNKKDVVIGQEYWYWNPCSLPTRVLVVGQGYYEDVFMCICSDFCSKEYVCAEWMYNKKPDVSDEFFDNWWEYYGGATEECFHWLGSNIGLVDFDGITNSNDLAEAIKQARYEQSTGRKWKDRK